MQVQRPSVQHVQSVGPGAVSRTQVLERHDGPPSARLVQQWDELARAVDAAPWSRPGWFLPWWQAFGGSPSVLVLRTAHGEVTGVLPLQRARSGLVSPTNWHTPEYSGVWQDAHARDRLLCEALRGCGSRLTVDFVSRDLREQLAAVAVAEGGRPHARVLESSPYVDLRAGWEDGLDRHLRAELRRRSRRLSERGALEFEVLDGTERLDALLEQGIAVEASGWKGRNGTAISSSEDTRTFYSAVARWAAEEGLLRLAFLRLDGRALAFDFAVEHGRAHYLLKTGYEESEAASAPGKLLRWEVLQHCAAQGLRSYEFLGHVQAWKHEWTPLRRHRYQAHAFPRTPAGVGGWAVHAAALPAARVARDRATAVVATVRARHATR